MHAMNPAVPVATLVWQSRYAAEGESDVAGSIRATSLFNCFTCGTLPDALDGVLPR